MACPAKPHAICEARRIFFPTLGMVGGRLVAEPEHGEQDLNITGRAQGSASYKSPPLPATQVASTAERRQLMAFIREARKFAKQALGR